MTARAPATRPHGQSYLSYSLTGITEKIESNGKIKKIRKEIEVNRKNKKCTEKEAENRNGRKIIMDGKKI